MICSGKAKKDIDYCKELAKINNGKCLSDLYVNMLSPLEWECTEGHKWKTAPNSISNGSWCPKCRRKQASNKCFKRVKCIENDTVYESVKSASIILKIPRQTISGNLNGRAKTARGLTFKYVAEIEDEAN